MLRKDKNRFKEENEFIEEDINFDQEYSIEEPEPVKKEKKKIRLVEGDEQESEEDKSGESGENEDSEEEEDSQNEEKSNDDEMNIEDNEEKNSLTGKDDEELNEEDSNKEGDDDAEENEDNNADENGDDDEEVEEFDKEGENQEGFENEDDGWERRDYQCSIVAEDFNKQVLKEFISYKASDIYLFEKDPSKENPYLTGDETYIPYPRKKYLKYAIQKVMLYQQTNELIDYHPNVNDLKGNLKDVVKNEMNNNNNLDDDEEVEITKRQQKEKLQNKKKKTEEIPPKIRNIIHQSLQPYNKNYCQSEKQQQIDKYFKRCKKIEDYDQWGKQFKTSPSEFLWLPAQFVFQKEQNKYQIEGKLFEYLEKCPYIDELKDELSQLMTYFSEPLKETHNYFKKKNYNLLSNNEWNEEEIYDIKKKVDFSERIHAIVKISEMEIAPKSVYNGQWHVEGFSSDNILYTCLYIIEQDADLTNGRLLFKRGPRADDVPADSMEQEQCAHQYCPDYEHLCDTKNLIPLGQLGLKEDLMTIFPNQNIHRVFKICNKTNKPLKRKIIAFFVVNHVDQPFTINDVEFTQPLSVIKENRLQDMYERSKNKQTTAQAFNYCEH